MIGESRTRSRKPTAPPLTDGVFLGAASQAAHTTTVTSLKTRIYDDFTNVDSWINVRGRLISSGGNLAPDTSILNPFTQTVAAAGYHRTQLLTDNNRVKVTIPSGTMPNGTVQFWFCGDRLMNHYYSIEMATILGFDWLSIVKGDGPNSHRRFGSTLVNVLPGDALEGWYDAPNSTIRLLWKGSQVTSLPVPPTEIPHGPGRRWCGAILGADWWVAPGSNLADFEAWDV